jgi:hypothetical protein
VPPVVRAQHVFGLIEIIENISEVTGIMSSYTASEVTQNGVFGGLLSQWITSFWAIALATNLLATRT